MMNMNEQWEKGLMNYPQGDRPVSLHPGDHSEDDEVLWLMSLALDGELDEAAAARLDALLREDVTLADDWQRWQQIDAELAQARSLEPPRDFAEKLDMRLLQWERRRKLRMGIVFGVAAVALWVSALAGVIGLGAFFWSNQMAWMGGILHEVALWWVALRQVGVSLMGSIDVLLNAPQTWAILACYATLAVGVLTSWFSWLRRSAQLTVEGNG